jgi:Skp family chaperone for outer membrane proteins
MPSAGGNDAVATGSRYFADHLREGRTMKKLFMLAMAAVFSMTVVSVGYAQTSGGTMEKKDAVDKKMEKKGEKMEKKGEKMEKKGEKMEKKGEKMVEKGATMKKEGATMKKDAANPCAAKADKK